jgi:ATP-dependent DNA ligase
LVARAISAGMLWRARNSRGRPLKAPGAFIHPCQPIAAKQPPSGPGWVHERKHDGYRLQIHVRDGLSKLLPRSAATQFLILNLVRRSAGTLFPHCAFFN